MTGDIHISTIYNYKSSSYITIFNSGFIGVSGSNLVFNNSGIQIVLNYNLTCFSSFFLTVEPGLDDLLN